MWSIFREITPQVGVYIYSIFCCANLGHATHRWHCTRRIQPH
jgi:hypothetical protein